MRWMLSGNIDLNDNLPPWGRGRGSNEKPLPYVGRKIASAVALCQMALVLDVLVAAEGLRTVELALIVNACKHSALDRGLLYLDLALYTFTFTFTFVVDTEIAYQI